MTASPIVLITAPEFLATAWTRTYRQSHANISAIDYLIAATAEIEGGDLLTLNVRHFPMYPDLSPAF